MRKTLLMLLACGGCVLNADAPTDQSVVDDGAVRVAPLQLSLDDGSHTTVLEDLRFSLPAPFERRSARLPFHYGGHGLALEAGQIAHMAAAGGEVGLTVDDDYYVVSLTRRDADASTRSRIEVLEFDFSLNGRVVHATLELDVSYHCPPYPNGPATPEKDGPPAVAAEPV